MAAFGGRCHSRRRDFVFAAQNLEIVSIDFLSFSVRTPLAFLVVAIYLLGMATGSSCLTLIRRSVEGARIGMGASTPGD